MNKNINDENKYNNLFIDKKEQLNFSFVKEKEDDNESNIFLDNYEEDNYLGRKRQASNDLII